MVACCHAHQVLQPLVPLTSPKNICPVLCCSCCSCWCLCQGPAPIFLLGVMMWQPADMKLQYCSGTASLAVQSIRTLQGAGTAAMLLAINGRSISRDCEDSRACLQASMLMPFGSITIRFELATATSSSLTPSFLESSVAYIGSSVAEGCSQTAVCVMMDSPVPGHRVATTGFGQSSQDRPAQVLLSLCNEYNGDHMQVRNVMVLQEAGYEPYSQQVECYKEQVRYGMPVQWYCGTRACQNVHKFHNWGVRRMV